MWKILSFSYRTSFRHMEWKPTDVTILFVYCWMSTCFRPTGPSSGEFVQLFTQPLVQCLCRSVRVLCMLWPVLVNIFYSYIAGSLHVSGPPAHLQESSYSCSHNHWLSFRAALLVCSVYCHNTQSTRTERHRNWTNGRVNSCTNSPEDGPVSPKHVEIQQYTNKIVTGWFSFHMLFLYCCVMLFIWQSLSRLSGGHIL